MHEYNEITDKARLFKLFYVVQLAASETQQLICGDDVNVCKLLGKKRHFRVPLRRLETKPSSVLCQMKYTMVGKRKGPSNGNPIEISPPFFFIWPTQ